MKKQLNLGSPSGVVDRERVPPSPPQYGPPRDRKNLRKAGVEEKNKTVADSDPERRQEQ